MEITAIFDSVDIAECALVQLRYLGIEPKGYKMRTAPRSVDPVDGAYGFPVALNTVNTDTAFTAPMMAPGPFALTGFSSINLGQNGSNGDNAARETLLQLEVPDHLAEQAKSALVSNHGRRVRTKR